MPASSLGWQGKMKAKWDTQASGVRQGELSSGRLWVGPQGSLWFRCSPWLQCKAGGWWGGKRTLDEGVTQAMAWGRMGAERGTGQCGLLRRHHNDSGLIVNPFCARIHTSSK